MSGYTMTQTELLYSCSQASTPVTTPTTTPGASMTPGLPPIAVPAGYMANASGQRASTLCLKIWGLLQATSTVPTFGFGLNYTSATPAVWSASTPLVTSTSAITLATGTTVTAPFYAQWDIAYRTPDAQGTSSGVVVAFGYVECPAFPVGLATSAGVSSSVAWMPPAGTIGNATAWDPNLTYYLWPSIFCGATTAGNYVTTEIVKLYGEN
jgi:hypothetical protein